MNDGSSLAEVTVVVLAWNDVADTTACLRSLATTAPAARRLVVDNGSDEPFATELAELCARTDTVLVRSQTNLGYGRGMNLGLAAVRRIDDDPGHVVVLSNNDVEYGTDAIDAIVRAARPGAVVVPRTIGPGGEVVTLPSAIPTIGRMAGMAVGLNLVARRRFGFFTAVDDADFFLGASVAATAGVWDRLGRMPSESFMYGEEVRLAVRRRRLGIPLAYLEAASVRHRESAAADRRWAESAKERRKATEFTRAVMDEAPRGPVVARCLYAAYWLRAAIGRDELRRALRDGVGDALHRRTDPDAPARVVVVCNGGGDGRQQRGGAERVVVTQIVGLRNAGWAVSALVPAGWLADELGAVGAPVTVAGGGAQLSLPYVLAIRRAIRRDHVAAVHVQLLNASIHGLVAAALVRRARRPSVVVTLHNSLVEEQRTATPSVRRKVAVYLVVLRVLVARTRATVHCVSEAEAVDYRDALRTDRVEVVGNPLDLDRLPSLAEVAAAFPSRTGVCFVGRLERQKAIDRLIRIVAAAGVSADTVLVGEGVMADEAARAGLRLLGFVERPMEVAMRSRVVLLASRWETFGLVAHEALACGIPVVCTDTGGLRALAAYVADGMVAYFPNLDTSAAITEAAAALTAQLAGSLDPDRAIEFAQGFRRRAAGGDYVRHLTELYLTRSEP